MHLAVSRLPRALPHAARVASRLLRRRNGAGAAFTAFALAWTAGAAASGPFPDLLGAADRDRLVVDDEVRRDTIAYVRAHAAPGQVALLDAVLRGAAQDVPAAQMAGDWRCRTIKLARNPALPMVAYADFRCRITDDAAGLQLRKLTGSQRTAGTFFDIGQARRAYAGALSLGGEAGPLRYGQKPERNQVGYLIPLSPTHMRLELPLPQYESDFDILELRR